MLYQKIVSDNTTIEFHNNWLGEETVIVNGQIVSKKYSIQGTDHYFTVMEEGHQVTYILTTRINAAMGVELDLRKNGVLVQEGIPVKYGSNRKRPANIEKKKGLTKLKEYDLQDALEHFNKALLFDVKDPEVHFHMACVYSVMERTKDGFESLKSAVANNLQDPEMILNHDMLAFLRMHEAFEGFLNSGFTTYDVKLVEGSEKDD